MDGGVYQNEETERLVATDECTMTENDKVIRDAVEAIGPDQLKVQLKEQLDEWKTIRIKIAVTGQSGVGKSTFINKFRGLTPNDKKNKDSKGNNLYAPVDEVEATPEVMQYEFEANPLIELFDLPGAGTKNFPIETYAEKINIKQYDAFILLTATRFQECDEQILQEIKKVEKPYFFGRTKTDIDMKNFADNNPEVKAKNIFEESWKQKISAIKINCMENLGGKTLEDIFLLSKNDFKTIKFGFSSKKIKLDDNERLKNTIIASLPDLQKTVLTFSLGPSTKEAIRMKVEELRSRMWRIVLLCAAGGAVPVPGVSFLIDRSLIASECEFQKEQLGIDLASLTKKAGSLYDLEQPDSLIGTIVSRCSVSPEMSKIYSLLLHSKDSDVMSEFYKECEYIKFVAPQHPIAVEVSMNILQCIPGIGVAISGSSTYIFLSNSLRVIQTLAEKCLEVVRDHYGLDTEDNEPDQDEDCGNC